MKKFYPLFILLALLLSSCKDLNDKRLDSVKERIATYSTQENITVLSTDFKSLAIPFHNHAVIEAVSKNARQLEIYKKNISAYKQKNFAEQDRVWIKDMTEEQITSYKKIMAEYEKLHDYFEYELKKYYSYSNHYNPEKDKNTSFWIKYKEESSESIKYGVFYFDSKKQTVITRHIIFDEQTYKFTTKLMDIAMAKVKAGYLVPSVNLDVVPEDEDPSKTKEERAAIKMKEKQEKEEREAREKQRKEAQERADMMRTNPILRTFYGVTLGNKSASRIVNHLRNQGFNVEEFAEEYDSNFNDYIDVAYWDEVRIFVRYPDGKFTGIQFTAELRKPYSRQRDYSRDTEAYYNRIINAYRDKYSFWSTSYDGSEYEDEKTKLKVKYWNSRVWVTYSLKGYTTPGV